MNGMPTEIAGEQDSSVLLTIQNSKKPEQTIYLVLARPNGHFETQGLNRLFGLKEIWIESTDVLNSLEEYAHVLSFLLETMSAAQDYRLPYGYQDAFEFAGIKYTLFEEGNHRLLKRVG